MAETENLVKTNKQTAATAKQPMAGKVLGSMVVGIFFYSSNT